MILNVDWVRVDCLKVQTIDLLSNVSNLSNESGEKRRLAPEYKNALWPSPEIAYMVNGHISSD